MLLTEMEPKLLRQKLCYINVEQQQSMYYFLLWIEW